MKTFKLHMKQTKYGEAIVEAETLVEAKEKFKMGQEKEFEDFSESFPCEWIITASDIYNDEIEDYEKVEG